MGGGQADGPTQRTPPSAGGGEGQTLRASSTRRGPPAGRQKGAEGGGRPALRGFAHIRPPPPPPVWPHTGAASVSALQAVVALARWPCPRPPLRCNAAVGARPPPSPPLGAPRAAGSASGGGGGLLLREREHGALKSGAGEPKVTSCAPSEARAPNVGQMLERPPLSERVPDPPLLATLKADLLT